MGYLVRKLRDSLLSTRLSVPCASGTDLAGFRICCPAAALLAAGTFSRGGGGLLERERLASTLGCDLMGGLCWGCFTAPGMFLEGRLCMALALAEQTSAYAPPKGNHGP